MGPDRFKCMGRLWSEPGARGPNLTLLNMTIAEPAGHLSQLPASCVACCKAIHSHLDRRIASLKCKKFHHVLRSSMAVHKLRDRLPATQRKLRPSHTQSARLCSKPLLLRCSVEGMPANRRSENTSHATASTQVQPHFTSNPAPPLPPKVSCAHPRH